MIQEPGAPDPVGSKYQEPGMGGYDAPPLQASPRGGPPPGGRPPRGARGKSPGARGGRFGSAVRGGRGGVAAAGGSRTPSNVRDYHHQPPVGYGQISLLLPIPYLCITVALQLVLAMVLSPPSQVMEGTLPLLRTTVMTRTMREMATMAALQTHEEMLAMIEEEVQLFGLLRLIGATVAA